MNCSSPALNITRVAYKHRNNPDKSDKFTEISRLDAIKQTETNGINTIR